MATPFGMEPEEQNLALSQGLLGLGAGLLSGSFGNYGAFAPALGKGVAGFQQGYSNSIDQNLKLKLFKQNQLLQNAQIGHYTSEIEKNKAALAEQERLRQMGIDADSFARGGSGGGAGGSGALSPTPPTGMLAPQVTAPPVGPGATALAGGAGPVGGGAGYGATGSAVPGAAQSVPVNPNAPQLAANGDQVLPPVNVTGKSVSPLLDPDYWLKSSEYKRQHGDMKGALADAEQSHKLRTEELTLNKDDRPKPLEGVPGITFDSKGFYEDGQPVKAARVQEIKNSLAKSGAANNNQKIDLKVGESIAKEVGPILAASRDEAVGAVEQIDSARRIKKAIDSGQVFSGPGASLKMAGAQALDSIGAAGSNLQEKIANTRQAIRGMAEFTISVRKKLKGQGQITEYEQKTLQKAYSGDIDSMTGPEIRTMADLTERMGRISYKNHQRQLDNMRNSKDESVKGLVPFYDVPDISADAPAPSPKSPGGWNDAKEQRLRELEQKHGAQ